MTSVQGTRCRSTREIVLPNGIVRRGTPGTIILLRENLGRELFTVAFDTCQKVIAFAHEIAFVGEELAA